MAKISAELLEVMRKGFTRPEEMQGLYAQLLQHMINRGRNYPRVT